MNELLFSYGTPREERVQLKLFGRKLAATKDALAGYKIATIEITDEKFIALGEQEKQSTLIFTGVKDDVIAGMALILTLDELMKTDRYEPVNYERKPVILESGKKAWIYIAS